MTDPVEPPDEDQEHRPPDGHSPAQVMERAVRSSELTADLEVLKMASEHFRQDISSHWAQASFFAVIQAAFISVFATAVGPQDVGKSGLLSV